MVNLSRKEEQRGTRAIMMWGVIVAAIVFIVLFAIFLLPVLLA